MVRGATVPGRWVDAGDLRVGDVLLLKPDRRVAIEEIQVRQVAEKVYNFQVAALHNYAVGQDRVLVHNNSWRSEVAKVAPDGTIRPSTKLTIESIETQVDGKLHGVLPKSIPKTTPTDVLEAAAGQLRHSIGVRAAKLPTYTVKAGHLERIIEEEAFLEQILALLP